MYQVQNRKGEMNDMIFGKEKAQWESLTGIFTAAEINQQPATWRKTIKQIEDSKAELKAFI